jgi:hypothetical protein
MPIRAISHEVARRILPRAARAPANFTTGPLLSR